MCGDPAYVGFPQRHVCFSTMERRAAERAYDELHKDAPFHDGSFGRWAKEWSEATPFHYLDGVTIYVAETDIHPDDHFTTERSASPFPDGPEDGPEGGAETGDDE